MLSFPTLPTLTLDESERKTLAALQRSAWRPRTDMLESKSYYDGTQPIHNLRIAVPKQLEDVLRTIVGWGAQAVDPYVARLGVDCFRVPTATDGDQHIADLMTANDFAAEQGLAFHDALKLGRAYFSVGSPVEKGDAPVIAVESPMNTTVLWDLRSKTPKAAQQEYWEGDSARMALLMPFKTIHLAMNDKTEWEVVDRDDHGFDFVPLVRMAHGATSDNRDGVSAITAAMRSLIDGACRTLLALEVAREIYSTPGMLILGATEDMFQNADGSPKAAWDTYITSVLALERDDEGNLPEIKQKVAYDPSVFTKILDWYASAMSGLVLSPPQNMGLYTQGNPASAESVVAMNSERDLHTKNVLHPQFGGSLVKVAQMALRFENKGKLPDEFKTLAVDWDSVALPTPGVTSDAVTKEIAAGAVPATSDVVLKRLGYNAVDRRRLEQDRKRDDGRKAAQAIADSLTQRATPEQASGSLAGL